ncbi:MAG: DUF1376 domain-containing protein [Pseudomonadota bacterium]
MTDFWAYPLRFGETLASNEWIEFHIHKFLTSKFLAYCLRDGEAGRAILGTAVILWTESYRQDPAGTLPDDDVELAQIARFGADVAGWLAVRDRVLHGWVPCHCDDTTEGQMRLGHPLIAEIATRSYHRKAGKAAGRTAAALSMAKYRVKKRLIGLGMKRLSDADDVVEAIARWLETSGLQISETNVRQGAEVVTGVPALRAVSGGKDD